MSSHNSHILVVDDHKSVSEPIAMILRSRGHSVCTAESGVQALRQLKDTRVKLVISDLRMPEMSGFELISAIRWRFPEMPVVAMSGTYTADQIPSTIDRFYAKGQHSPDALVTMVEELLSTCHKKQTRSAWAGLVIDHRRVA